MSNQVQWVNPFDDQFGNGMVYRLFPVENKLFGVGFQELQNMYELTSKGIDILRVKPDFVFPNNGVWAVVFDEIDPNTMSFQGFGHVAHTGNNGGRVLLDVASILLEHYNVCNAGAYIFSAAIDKQHVRKTDLLDMYSKALGVNGHRPSRLFNTYFGGWNPYSDAALGGRGYVITTQSY